MTPSRCRGAYLDSRRLARPGPASAAVLPAPDAKGLLLGAGDGSGAVPSAPDPPAVPGRKDTHPSVAVNIRIPYQSSGERRLRRPLNRGRQAWWRSGRVAVEDFEGDIDDGVDLDLGRQGRIENRHRQTEPTVGGIVEGALLTAAAFSRSRGSEIGVAVLALTTPPSVTSSSGANRSA